MSNKENSHPPQSNTAQTQNLTKQLAQQTIMPSDNILSTVTNKAHDTNRRNFLVKTFGISIAGLLASSSFTKTAEAKDYYETLPPGFRPKLCQDPVIAYCYDALLSTGTDKTSDILNIKNLLVEGWSNGVQVASWYCEPAFYVVIETFRTHQGNDSIYLLSTIIDKLANKFYHNSMLYSGIDMFYRQHVRHGNYQNTEKYLITSLFACAEKHPQNGNIKAEIYLNANFKKRTHMIIELSNIFNSMNWSENDKKDRNISGERGKGPLNNWYRLLSAQWGAYFLTTHYEYKENNGAPWSRKNSKNEQISDMESIFWNIEHLIAIKKEMGYLRRPPNDNH